MRRRGLDILAALRVEEPDGDNDGDGDGDDDGDDDGDGDDDDDGNDDDLQVRTNGPGHSNGKRGSHVSTVR